MLWLLAGEAEVVRSTFYFLFCAEPLKRCIAAQQAVIHRRTKDPTPTQPGPKSYTYVSILRVPGWSSVTQRLYRKEGGKKGRKEGRRKDRKERRKERRKEKGRGGDEREGNEGIKVGRKGLYNEKGRNGEGKK